MPIPTRLSAYTRRTVYRLVLFYILCHFLPLSAQTPQQESRPEINWYVHDNSVIGQLSQKRLFISPSGNGWLAGRVKRQDMKQKDFRTPLFRLEDGEWRHAADFPGVTNRTFEMSTFGEDMALVIYTDSWEDSLVIYRYKNRQWFREPVEPGIFPQASAIVSEDEAWIVGNHGNMRHYKNGKWQVVRLPGTDQSLRNKNLTYIKMLDKNYGWTTGHNGILARYKNSAWEIIPPPEHLAGNMFNGVDITSDSTVWIIGWDGLILSYRNSNWKQHNFFTNSKLHSIRMLSPTEGWIVGGAGIILYFNGVKWIQQHSPIRDEFRSIAIQPNGTGWIAGNNTILTTTTKRFHPFTRNLTRSQAVIDGKNANLVAAFDFDNDLDNDIFAITVNSTTLFRNDGNGTMSDISEPTHLSKQTDPATIVCFAIGDLDHDNHPEIILTRDGESTNSLYQNTGTGFFLEQTFAGEAYSGNNCYLIDFDLDGDMDYYYAQARAKSQPHGPNYLYLNNGFGKFSLLPDITGTSGSEQLALWGDLNGDMYPDLILPEANASLECHLNDGAGKLIDFSEQSGLLNKMSGQINQALLEDIDIDGDLDFIAIGIAPHVWINDGNARFTHNNSMFMPELNNDLSASKTISCGDLNHDGISDFLFEFVKKQSTIYRLYLSNSLGQYDAIDRNIGLQYVSGHSVLIEDRDSDGDLDLYFFQFGGGNNIYLENKQNDDNYLIIIPQGSRANRLGIGSEIKIYEAGKLGNPDYLRGYRQHGLGKNPRMVSQLTSSHFGLSSAKKYDIKIRFPGGREVVKKNIATGQTLKIYEYPPGIHHAYLTWRASLLAISRASSAKEIPKLLIFMGLLSALYLYFKNLHTSLTFFRNWPKWSLFIFGYLTLNSFYMFNTSLLIDAALIFFPMLFATIVVYLDSYYSFWRGVNYLGHYKLLSKLGEGGMGIVHKAYNVNMRRTSALKVLHNALLDSEKNRMRFLREAKIMESLKHRNIVKIFETGEIAGRGYINMELLEGLTLGEFIKQSNQLSAGILVPIVLQICDALEYMHDQDIIHRDIKSDNIFLITSHTNLSSRLTRSLRVSSIEENVIRVKLMDFGLARSMQMLTLTKMEAIVGTLAYMSPEQAIGREVDQRSDIYSLGVVMYEALTGQFPFSGEHEVAMLQSIIANKRLTPINELRPDIIPELEKIITRMLQYNPADRFASSSDLKEALQIIPISLETVTLPKPQALEDHTARQLSQKSIVLLKNGDFSQAAQMSKRAIERLNESNQSELNSGQILLNHFKVLKATGKTNEARKYLQKAHQSVIIKKITRSKTQSIAISPDPTDREIVIRYETERWQNLYQKAIELNDAKKIGDARNTILECAGILTQALMLFDTENDKEKYIKKFEVAIVLNFMKEFGL